MERANRTFDAGSLLYKGKHHGYCTMALFLTRAFLPLHKVSCMLVIFILAAILLFVVILFLFFPNVFTIDEKSGGPARLKLIETILGCEIGNEFVELKNIERFHPDNPVEVWLIFDQDRFSKILDHVKNAKYNRISVLPDSITISPPSAEKEEGTFIQQLILKIDTRELIYVSVNCP